MRVKPNVKIGLVILLFSILTTFVIAGGLFFWQKLASNTNLASSLGTDIYVMNAEERQAVNSDQAVTIEASQLINSQEFDNLYSQIFFENLPLVLLLICLVVVTVTLLLWLLVRRIYQQQTLAIIDELTSINESDERNTGKDPIGLSLNQLRDTFAGNLDDYRRLSSYLTHDQKNTIAVLRTNLEQKESTEEELALLDALTDSVDDILTLTSNPDEATELVDVALVCAEVCDTYQKLYPALHFDFDEDDDLTIIAKSRWIYRAVSNLLSNAIKYGKQQPILISVRKKNQTVIIKVQDQGLGMSAGEQAKVFDHKYRVKGLKQDGYGIGLSVVRHVCDLCQGFIFLESQKDQGSTFYLSFPSA